MKYLSMVSCRKIAESIFHYKTPKIVKVKSILVGVISRLVQLTILAYIFGYAIIYKKGYQEFSDVESSVTTKVKGVIFTNFSDEAFSPDIAHPEWYRRVWDVSDYVIPPSEIGAAFIATNVIITANQTWGICAEDPSIADASCDPSDNTCVAGRSVPAGNGVMTGNCIKANEKSGKYSCEIKSWCPVEDDSFPLKNQTAVLEGSQDFTILIKNFVHFPKFPMSNRRNIKDSSNSSYLRNCLYDPNENKDCPKFRLGDIVKWCGQDFNDIALQGGVVAIMIKWDCDLDFDKKNCFPTYEFNRLDDPRVKLASGWNFRYANYYSDTTRTLYKLYGIRLSISVVGQAGKFRVIPLLTNVGAGLGLLAAEVFICDVIVLHILRKKHYYNSKKYEEADSEKPTVLEICIPKRRLSI